MFQSLQKEMFVKLFIMTNMTQRALSNRTYLPLEELTKCEAVYYKHDKAREKSFHLVKNLVARQSELLSSFLALSLLCSTNYNCVNNIKRAAPLFISFLLLT